MSFLNFPLNAEIRKVKTSLILGDGIAFRYGAQSGQGGLELQNSSSIIGNVYSNGPVTGSNNYIYGEVVSAGSSGLVSGIHATGTVFAHSLENSAVDKDAYYTTISNTDVSGSSYPNSPDEPLADLPISDNKIEEWKQIAVDGTVIDTPCPYTISADTTLGPAKINCDLIVTGNGTTLSLTGHVWVVGNITARLSSQIRIDPSLGSQSVALIADNPSNRSTGSTITLQNNTAFQGSGAANSFVFLISQNNSAESGGTKDAIIMTQGSGAAVAYAGHGLITLANTVDLKEITAYKIILKNSASITYESGLPSTLFSSGPGGGYDILRWQEVE